MQGTNIGWTGLQIFHEFVWPVISEHCGGGRVIPFENSGTSQLLGVDSDIHAIQNLPLQGNKGLNIRTGYDKDWSTFVIGRPQNGNPIDNLLEKYNSDSYLLPYYSIQTYFDRSTHRVLSIGVIETREMLEYLHKNPYSQRWNINQYDGGQFYYANWHDLETCKSFRCWRFNDS